jgi:hypothetical protein
MDLPGGIEETHENLFIRIFNIPAKIRSGHLPNTNQKRCRLSKTVKNQSFRILSIYRRAILILILSVTLAIQYFHITLLPNSCVKYTSTRKDVTIYIETRIHQCLHMRACVRMCMPTNKRTISHYIYLKCRGNAYLCLVQSHGKLIWPVKYVPQEKKKKDGARHHKRKLYAAIK